MPQSDPVTGLRSAIGGDKPSFPLHTGNLVADLRGKVIPTFQTATARDLAIQANVFTPSGIPQNFKVNIIDSGTWEWDGNSWVPFGGPRIASDRTFNGSLLAPDATQVSITSVHNQLCSMYRARLCQIVASDINLSGTAGDRWRIQLGIDSTIYQTIQGVHDITGGPGQIYEGAVSKRFVLQPSATHRLLAYLSRPSGTGTTTLLNINVQVSDEGPAAVA